MLVLFLNSCKSSHKYRKAMFSKQFSVSPETALLLSVAVLLPLVAVVVGCAICRRLWRKLSRRNDEEDEEKRPLLRENTRQQSLRTESVEHSPEQEDRNSGEQTSPTNTGNRIDVPCMVHTNAAAEADQKQETKTSTAAEETLIPGLVKTDEDEPAAEDLGRIQPQYNPPQQHTESVFEPRPAIENEEIPKEHSAQETDSTKETHEPESETNFLSDGKETLQEPQLSVNAEAKTVASCIIDSTASAAEGILEEKTLDHREPMDSGRNAKEINKITDPVNEQTTEGETGAAAAAAAAAAGDDDEETTEDNATTATQQASSVFDKQVEIDFQVKLAFVKTIRTKAAKKEGRAVFGVTSLDNEVFVISQHSSDVEVYDDDDDSRSMEFKRQFPVEGLFDPVDITSCPTNRCLYIFDWKGGESNEILRLDSEGKMLFKWSTGVDGGFLSMAPGGNVVLSVWDKSMLREYSPEGQEIREIQLPCAVGELRLGIRLSNGKLIVSKGEEESAEHRVCLLDEKGEEILRSFGGGKGSSSDQLNGPNYMNVDMKSGYVLVADQNNRRVILLDNELKFKREIVKESDGLRYPVRLELVSGRLFVADNDFNLHDQVWRDGRIMIFDFSIQQQPVES